MRPHLVVVLAPPLDLGARVRQIPEPVLVEAFVPKLSVEGLGEGIVHRLAGSDEVQPDAASVSPGIEGLAREFRAVVITMSSGSGRVAAIRSSTRVTRTPESDVSTPIATHSRLQSSTMLSVRKIRPLASSAHRTLHAGGMGHSRPCRTRRPPRARRATASTHDGMMRTVDAVTLTESA